MLKTVAIIPCRYASTRLPGKPLREIAGKTLIHHIYENVMDTQLFSQVIVATDDERIVKEVQSFNGEIVISDKEHLSGSDRVAEIARSIETDIVVNIQGDELFLGKEELSELLKCFQDSSTSVVTLAHPLFEQTEIANPNRVKVVCDKKSNAIYFSRSVIPYLRSDEKFNYLGHIGVYAFRKNALMKFAEFPQSKLEKTESLEQLRLLENGIKIKVIVTEHQGFGIDTEEDIKAAEKLLKNI